MSVWSNLFKVFQDASEKDPLVQLNDPKNFPIAGTTQPDALNAPNNADSGNVNLRQSYDLVDTTNVTARLSRYKEYDRLRSVPEIEQTLTIISDEACVAGNTEIPTLFGYQTIASLAKKYSPNEKFLVYSWDFKKEDYTLGWAFHPRFVKKAKTITLTFDNGSQETTTEDHQFLTFQSKWVECQDLKIGDELKAFYKIPANHRNELKIKQFPRIYSMKKGWMSEREFVDEWKTGKITKNQERVHKIMQMIGAKVPGPKIAEYMGHDWNLLVYWMRNEGFTYWETKQLYKNEIKRKIIGITRNQEEIDVYDMSVEDHKCFATKNTIVHNCQKDEDGNIFKISVSNEHIKKDLETLFRHRKLLNINRNGWIWFKNLCIFGDQFIELGINPDNPKEGVYKAFSLPPETMFRLETIQGKLLEFQQADGKPDYNVLSSTPENATQEVSQNTTRRFAPNQMVHMRIGDNRINFYPYGQSLIEPAKGPAYNLKLMEDSMIVYRLARAAERRVFYIDVGGMPQFRADALLDRMKDQFRKRKTTNTSGNIGSNQVEEKWVPPSVDEDIWLAIRPQSNTRIETLPGAQNLGEVDDAIFFRNKLYKALNFPEGYFSNTDATSTRITLSANDCKFARMIERLQGYFEDSMLEIAEIHLELKGYPSESYEDLKIKMTPPSEWRELSRAEVVSNRYGNAANLKGSLLMSDRDILIKILKYSETETDDMIARLKIQKLEELKMAILGQNPGLVGIGIPGDQQQNGQEMPTEPTGNATAAPLPEDQNQSQPQDQPAQDQSQPQDQPAPQKPAQNEVELEEPSDKDIKKFDLEITDYETEMDTEEPDYSIVEI